MLLAGATLVLSACASETPEQKHELGCAAGTLTGAVLGGLAGSLVGGGVGTTIATAAGAGVGTAVGAKQTCSK
jgi:outer membrane lipoprotein SlyB